jgi:hypothetical protein
MNLVLSMEDVKGEVGKVVETKGGNDETYTVTFCAGSDDVEGDVPEPITFNVGQIVIIPGHGNLEHPDALFDGWKAEETGVDYTGGETVPFSQNIKMVAQWLWVEGEEPLND